MISNNKPLDWDVVCPPIGQLVEVLFAIVSLKDIILNLIVGLKDIILNDETS